MPVYKIPVIVARAGKANELPANHVAVPAIKRIGKETLDRVLQQEREKRLRLNAAFELRGAAFERP
jgi:hypothetical protein